MDFMVKDLDINYRLDAFCNKADKIIFEISRSPFVTSYSYSVYIEFISQNAPYITPIAKRMKTGESFGSVTQKSTAAIHPMTAATTMRVFLSVSDEEGYFFTSCSANLSIFLLSSVAKIIQYVYYNISQKKFQ